MSDKQWFFPYLEIAGKKMDDMFVSRQSNYQLWDDNRYVEHMYVAIAGDLEYKEVILTIVQRQASVSILFHTQTLIASKHINK